MPMGSNLSDGDWKVLEVWLNDQHFINWAKNDDPEDVTFWENHFNRHPNHWELGKVGKSLILGISFKNIPTDRKRSQAALAKLTSQLEKKSRHQENLLTGSSRRFAGRWLVAASLAVLLISSSIVYWLFFYNPSTLISTAFGQQLEVELPDGSVCTLNADSKLRYHKQEPRKVWLEGEAYFEILKTPEIREDFRVITKDLAVTVLGTAFNINTRNDETKVFLEEGKVRLDIADSHREYIEMQPGELIGYSLQKKELQKYRRDASALQTASWKEGALIFKEKLLLEALFDIEDIYGIQFIIQTDVLREETITGGVPIRNLQVTLNTLTEVYGLQMHAAGKRYFITGRE